MIWGQTLLWPIFLYQSGAAEFFDLLNSHQYQWENDYYFLLFLTFFVLFHSLHHSVGELPKETNGIVVGIYLGGDGGSVRQLIGERAHANSEFFLGHMQEIVVKCLLSFLIYPHSGR